MKLLLGRAKPEHLLKSDAGSPLQVRSFCGAVLAFTWDGRLTVLAVAGLG
jgi:hypothetical protein